MMNSELGFGRRVLQALEDNGISFEQIKLCTGLSDEEIENL